MSHYKYPGWQDSDPYVHHGQTSWLQNQQFYQEADKKYWDEKPYAYPTDRPTGLKAKLIVFLPVIIVLLLALIALHILHKKCKSCKKNERERETRPSRSQARNRQQCVTRDEILHVNERNNVHAQVHRPITPSAPSFHSEDSDSILSSLPLEIVSPSHQPNASQQPSSAEDLPPSYNDVIHQLKR